MSVSNNELRLDCCEAELDLDYMLRYAGRVDTGDNDTVTVDGFTVGNVSINGNTVSQLDAMYLLERFAAVDDADSDANVDLSFTSLNLISLGNVSLNNNTSRDLDADYLLRKAGFIDTDDGADVDRGAIAIGVVTLNDNTLVTNCGCRLDAQHLLELAAGTSDEENINGGDVRLGAFTIAGVQVNGNTVGNPEDFGDIELDNLGDQFGTIDATNGADVTVGQITAGPVEVNGNTVFKQDTIDARYFFQDAFDLEANGTNTTVDLTGVSFDGFSFDNNNMFDGADLDLMYAFENLFNIDTSGTGNEVEVGPVSLGLISVSNNTLSGVRCCDTGGEIEADYFLRGLFEMNASSGATAFVESVTLVGLTIDGNDLSIRSEDMEFDELMDQSFDLYADGTNSKTLIGVDKLGAIVGFVSLGPVSISNNTVGKGEMDFDDWLDDFMEIYAWNSATASVGPVTFGAIAVNGNVPDRLGFRRATEPR